MADTEETLHLLRRGMAIGQVSLRRSRGIVLVAHSEITFKWSQKNLIARLTPSCGRSDSSTVARDSA
jgi:hypothetical protein